MEELKNLLECVCDSYPDFVKGILVCTGCYCRKVGEHIFDEVPLFTKHLSYEDAVKYRKSYGKYLRCSQWTDLDVEVVMLL